jgi:hypothetical protein
VNGSFNDYLSSYWWETSLPVWVPTALFTNIHIGYITSGAARWTNHPSDGTLPWKIVPQALIERKRVLTNLSYLAYAGGLRFRTDSPSNYFNSTGLGGSSVDFHILLPPPGTVTDLAGVQTNTLTYSAWPNTNRPYGAAGQDYSSIGWCNRTSLLVIVDSDKTNGSGNEVYSGSAEFYHIHPLSYLITREESGKVSSISIQSDTVSWQADLAKQYEGVVEFQIGVNSCALISNVGLGFTYRTVP